MILILKELAAVQRAIDVCSHQCYDEQQHRPDHVFFEQNKVSQTAKKLDVMALQNFCLESGCSIFRLRNLCLLLVDELSQAVSLSFCLHGSRLNGDETAPIPASLKGG